MHGGTRPPNCPFSGGGMATWAYPSPQPKHHLLRIKKEDIHVQDALRTCDYPEWSFQKARRQIKQMKPKKKTGCSSDKTFDGDSLCRESFRDSSQDHEKNTMYSVL